MTPLPTGFLQLKSGMFLHCVQSFTSRGLKAGLDYCWRHPGLAEKFKDLPSECDPATRRRALAQECRCDG